MGIYSAHLVLEALYVPKVAWKTWLQGGESTDLGDASDHVDDEGLNCPQASDVLAATLPYREADLDVLALLEPDVHVNVTDILRQRSAGTLDGNEAGLDVHGDSFRDVEFFSLEDVTHL